MKDTKTVAAFFVPVVPILKMVTRIFYIYWVPNTVTAPFIIRAFPKACVWVQSSRISFQG
jgi:hypothetical protein